MKPINPAEDYRPKILEGVENDYIANGDIVYIKQIEKNEILEE